MYVKKLLMVDNNTIIMHGIYLVLMYLQQGKLADHLLMEQNRKVLLEGNVSV